MVDELRISDLNGMLLTPLQLEHTFCTLTTDVMDLATSFDILIRDTGIFRKRNIQNGNLLYAEEFIPSWFLPTEFKADFNGLMQFMLRDLFDP